MFLMQTKQLFYFVLLNQLYLDIFTRSLLTYSCIFLHICLLFTVHLCHVMYYVFCVLWLYVLSRFMQSWVIHFSFSVFFIYR